MKKNIHLRAVSIGIALIVVGLAIVFVNYNLVYAGIAEKVIVRNGDTELEGILVRPDSPGPHPAIVLLHSSGSSQSYNKWFYRIHTNVFVRKGFAVLSYSKRGTEIGGDAYKLVTFQGLIADGVAAVEMLRGRPDIIHDQIGLFGVSESGWFTPEIAQTAEGVAFVINRVSSPLPWTEVVLYEWEVALKEEGLTDEAIDEILVLQARVYQFYIDAANDETVALGPERDTTNLALVKMNEKYGDVMDSSLDEYNRDLYLARASKYSYDPSPYLANIDIPMIYLLSGQDQNILFGPSLIALEKLIDENGKNITVQTFPEADHYLYRWGFFPMEGFYVDGYLDTIGNWAEDQINIQ